MCAQRTAACACLSAAACADFFFFNGVFVYAEKAAELAFQRVPGVLCTCVGYVGGEAVDPTYEDVVSGVTGHAEAVAVDYDCREVSYEQLLEIFWDLLGDRALTKHRSGNDVRCWHAFLNVGWRCISIY